MTDAAFIKLVRDFMQLKTALIAELLRRSDCHDMSEYAEKSPQSFKGFFMDDIFFT